MRLSFLRFVPVMMLLAVAVSAQQLSPTAGGEAASALQNYFLGRSLEAQGLTSEAAVHFNEAIRITQDEIGESVMESEDGQEVSAFRVSDTDSEDDYYDGYDREDSGDDLDEDDGYAEELVDGNDEDEEEYDEE